MPLYTVRSRIATVPGVHRGSSFVETTWHFHWLSEGSALAEWGDLLPKFQEDTLNLFLWCLRGGLPVHTLTLYERDINDATSWEHKAEIIYSLEDFPAQDVTIDIAGVPTTFSGAWVPLYPHRRAGMLLRQTGTEGETRRVYLAPLTDYYTSIDVEILGVDLLKTVWPRWDDDAREDGLPPNDADSVDLWRRPMLDLVLEWAANLGDGLPGGGPVVPSFKNGTWSNLAGTQGSPVRADIRSRSLRSVMTPPVVG